MVGAPRSSTLALKGPFSINGGRSLISSIAFPWARHRHFLRQWWVLLDLRHHLPGDPPSTFFSSMVVAPRSPRAPPRGPAIDIFWVNGLLSRISVIASQGPRSRRLQQKVVGTLGLCHLCNIYLTKLLSPTWLPPRGGHHHYPSTTCYLIDFLLHFSRGPPSTPFN
jgi:hypothetical protein